MLQGRWIGRVRGWRTLQVAVASVIGYASPAFAVPLAQVKLAPVSANAPGALGSDAPDRLGAYGETSFVARLRRSSSAGNAEFPEREPMGVNLGNVSGGRD